MNAPPPWFLAKRLTAYPSTPFAWAMRRILSGVCFLAVLSCSRSSEQKTEQVTVSKSGAVTLTDPRLMPPEQKFFSAGNPGPWEKQRADHTPFVQVKETGKDQFAVEVSVGFDGDGPHYVENLILINHSMKEIKKADFKRGNKTATARFDFTRKPEDKYYVLAKCSMHDVWQAEVKLPQPKSDED